MHLCKNCVHRGFLSCLKVKGSCKVGGEVCLTILFNLFGENRKGAGRAHIWSSLWLLLWKQLISFVFFFFITGKSENRYLRKKEPDLLLQGHLVKSCWSLLQCSSTGKGWPWEEPLPAAAEAGAPAGSGRCPWELPGALWSWATAAAAGEGRRWNYTVERGEKQRVWRDENTEFRFHPANILRNPFRGVEVIPCKSDSSVFMFCRHLQTTEMSK